MSEIIAFKLGDTEHTEFLTQALTSPDEATRCTGRLIATGIGEVMQDWLNAELARGTSADLLLLTVADISLQHLASVAGCAIRPSGDASVKALLRSLVERRYDGYVAAIRSAMQKGGSDG